MDQALKNPLESGLNQHKEPIKIPYPQILPDPVGKVNMKTTTPQFNGKILQFSHEVYARALKALALEEAE